MTSKQKLPDIIRRLIVKYRYVRHETLTRILMRETGCDEPAARIAIRRLQDRWEIRQVEFPEEGTTYARGVRTTFKMARALKEAGVPI